MAKKSKPAVIEFPNSWQKTTTGLGTMNIFVEHGLERLEKGITSGIDQVTIRPSSKENQVYADQIKYVPVGGDEKRPIDAALIDVGTGKRLLEVSTLNFHLSEKPKAAGISGGAKKTKK